ncbi:hypothetical protein [Arthrobacter sp. NPDC058192]|uniref:hypothetical protein n=1 Tax=Arthrobacter sp. NPDC058192 TaxID=3346372 RepID=UPI0036E23192
MEDMWNEIVGNIDGVSLFLVSVAAILLGLSYGMFASLRKSARGDTNPRVFVVAGIVSLGVGIVLGVAGVTRAVSIVNGILP